eukprot:sb/3461964/
MLAVGDTQIQVRLDTSEKDYSIDQNVFSLPHTASISELQDLIKSLLNIDDDSVEFSFRINDELLSTTIGKFCEQANFSGESVLKVEYFLKREAPEKTDEISVNDWVGGLSFSSKFLYGGLYNGQITRISASTLETKSFQVHEKPIKCIKAIRSEKSGDLIVTGSIDQTLVYSLVGEEEESRSLFNLRGHTESVTCVSVSPSTEQIVSGSFDTMLKIWSTSLDEPDEDKKRKKKRKDGVLRTPLLTLGGHAQAITGCTWQDNSQIVTVSQDASVKFWDTQLMTCTKTITINTALQAVSWSDKSRLVATGASDKFVRLFDPRGTSGALVHSTLFGHDLWVSDVCWSPESEFELVTGSYDNSVLLWDTRNPRSFVQRITNYHLIPLGCHEDKVLSVVWKEGQIVSGGADKTVVYSYSLFYPRLPPFGFLESRSNMAGGCRQLPFAIFLSLCYLTLAVNRGNFKTCDQSGFCKRLRATEKDRSPYIVETVKKVNGSSIEIAVKHESGPNRYRAFLRVLKDRSVRFTMEEKEPVRPRYSPVDSLGPNPLQDGAVTLETGSDSATVVFGDDKVLISYNPLRVDVFSSGELQISLNARGLLTVETQQLKPQPEEPAPAEGEEGKKEEDDDLGMSAEDLAAMEWEESFKSHHDSNPRGPRAVGLDMSFIGYDKVYGLPEHADDFALKSTADTDPYRLYNLDVFEYELDNPMALYGSIPYITALSKTGRNVGVMWLNAAETWVDIADTSDKSLVGRVLSSFVTSDDVSRVDTHFMSESGLLDVFIFLGPSPKDVSRQYSEVFGASYLPSVSKPIRTRYLGHVTGYQPIRGHKWYCKLQIIWLIIENMVAISLLRRCSVPVSTAAAEVLHFLYVIWLPYR